MAGLAIGRWKLKVRDLTGSVFERYLVADGEQLYWAWKSNARGDPNEDEAELLTNYDEWRDATAPWLKLEEIARDTGGVALITEHAAGVRCADLFDALDGPMPLPAAAWLALQTAQALNTIDERGDGRRVRDFSADSVLLGFDGGVRLTPWPDLLPPGSRTGHLVPLDYLLPEQVRWTDIGVVWRAWGPSVLLLHALGGRAPFRGTSTSDTVQRIVTCALVKPELIEQLPSPLRTMVASALTSDGSSRPEQESLIDALKPLADPAWLLDALRRHFPAEEHEQRFERDLAFGRDPEPLPPELVRAVAQGDDDSLGVLADWMLSEGRPRGELAAIQRRLSRGADLTLQRTEAELLVRHRSLLPHSLRERLTQWKPIWTAGWLVGLELRAVPPAPELEEILTHPTLRFLRRLRVSENAGRSQAIADVLSSVSLPALKRVELDGAMPTHGARLKAARPHLEVGRNVDHSGFPSRRRPEKAVPEARVGLDGRAPAQGIGFLGRVWDWLNTGD